MRIIETDVNNWKRSGDFFTIEDGRVLEPRAQKDFCQFYGLPATLLQVDSKYNTNTLLDVAKKAVPDKVKVTINNEDKVCSVLDPKSVYLDNEKFDLIIQQVAQSLGDPNIRDKGASREALFTVPQSDSDRYLDDLYHKNLKVTRLPQGGVAINAAILRLICTNGSMVPDKQFSHIYRSSVVDAHALNLAVADVMMINLEEYLNSMFTANGVPIEASVAHFYGMRDTLRKITDKETSELYYDDAPITAFYLSQGIDVQTLPRNSMSGLRSGLTYYDCYNILTHAAKQNDKKSLSDEIEVGKWIKPSYIGQLKQVGLSYQGAPTFPQERIKSLKGDAA